MASKETLRDGLLYPLLSFYFLPGAASTTMIDAPRFLSEASGLSVVSFWGVGPSSSQDNQL